MHDEQKSLFVNVIAETSKRRGTEREKRRKKKGKKKKTGRRTDDCTNPTLFFLIVYLFYTVWVVPSGTRYILSYRRRVVKIKT